MRFDKGCSDRQRRLAANEDAACAISMQWRPGRLEDALYWQRWLNFEHAISRNQAWIRLGLQPPLQDIVPTFGRPVATSEYKPPVGVSLDGHPIEAYWVQTDDGAILGYTNYGVYWWIEPDEKIPQVRYVQESGQELSACCAAPLLSFVPTVPLDIIGTGFSDDVITRIVATRVCGQCFTNQAGRAHGR